MTKTPIDHVPTHPEVLTLTKAKTLRRCPRRLKRVYIDRAQELASEALERGSSCHDWLEDVGRLLVTPGANIDDEELYRMMLVRAALLDDEPAQDLRDLAHRMIATGTIPSIPETAEEVAFEKAWAIDVDGRPCDWNDPRCLIRSLYDLVFLEHKRTTGTVRDYKTNRRMDVDPFQIRLYAWSLFRHEPELVEVFGELLFVRFGRNGVKTISPKLIEKGRLEVEMMPELHSLRDELKRRLDEDAWEPRISDDCRWCSHRASCPPFREKVKPISLIVSREQAVKAADMLVVLEGQTSEIKKALEGWVEGNGTIDLGGDELGFVRGERESIDDTRKAAGMFRKLLKANGTPDFDEVIWRAMHLPKAELGKLITKAIADAPRGEKKIAREGIWTQLREKGLLASTVHSTFKRRQVTEEFGDEDGE